MAPLIGIGDHATPSVGVSSRREWMTLSGRKSGYLHSLSSMKTPYTTPSSDRTSGTGSRSERLSDAKNVGQLEKNGGQSLPLSAGSSVRLWLSLAWWQAQRVAEKVQIPSVA